MSRLVLCPNCNGRAVYSDSRIYCRACEEKAAMEPPRHNPPVPPPAPALLPPVPAPSKHRTRVTVRLPVIRIPDNYKVILWSSIGTVAVMLLLFWAFSPKRPQNPWLNPPRRSWFNSSSVTSLDGYTRVKSYEGNGPGTTGWFTVKDDWRFEWYSRDDFAYRRIIIADKQGNEVANFFDADGGPIVDRDFVEGGTFYASVKYEGSGPNKGPWKIIISQGTNRINY